MREDEVSRSLSRLLGVQDLPDRVTKEAEAIHTALTRPKRVALMGPPKSGKADLMALLAGKRVVGADVPLGTMRLVYGERAHTRMIFPDGSQRQMDGVPTAASLTFDVMPVATTISAPLPALRKISLMQLAAANSMEDQVKAMKWAASKNDIVIWCTTRFSTVERKMWLQMSEHVRDHAFALRTSLVDFDYNVDTARRDLGLRVGDEFAFVFAADLKTALSAQISNPIDTDGMKKSGITKVISTLLKEIDQGRENAEHKAQLLLAKYPAPAETPQDRARAAAPTGDQMPAKRAVPEPAADVAPAPVPVDDKFVEAVTDLAGAAPEHVDPPVRSKPSNRRKDRAIFPTFETDPLDTQTKSAPTPAPEPEAKAKPAQATVTDAVKRPALAKETVVVCNDMIMRLSKLGTTKPDANGHREMFDQGLLTLSWVETVLMDVANDDVPRVARLQQMTEEATDYIHLLRLENNDTAALDAVTILLQMKRSVQSLLAA